MANNSRQSPLTVGNVHADDNDRIDVTMESSVNLTLLDPPKYGWSAGGGIVDVLPPVERARRKVTKDAFVKRMKRKERIEARKHAIQQRSNSRGGGSLLKRSATELTTADGIPPVKQRILSFQSTPKNHHQSHPHEQHQQQQKQQQQQQQYQQQQHHPTPSSTSASAANGVISSSSVAPLGSRESSASRLGGRPNPSSSSPSSPSVDEEGPSQSMDGDANANANANKNANSNANSNANGTVAAHTTPDLGKSLVNRVHSTLLSGGSRDGSSPLHPSEIPPSSNNYLVQQQQQQNQQQQNQQQFGPSSNKPGHQMGSSSQDAEASTTHAAIDVDAQCKNVPIELREGDRREAEDHHHHDICKGDNDDGSLSLVHRGRALNESGTTVDMYTYHRGREGFEPRDLESGELLCDVAPSDSTFGWEPKRLRPSITVTFPIGDCDDRMFDESLWHSQPNKSQRGDKNGDRNARPRPMAAQYFRETLEWDLTDPSTPTPMAFATNVSEEYGLDFGQTMDLATSIQHQIDDYVAGGPSYTLPLSLKDGHGNERAKVNSHGQALQLYGAPVEVVRGGFPLPKKRRVHTAERKQPQNSRAPPNQVAADDQTEDHAAVAFKSEPEYRAEVLRRAKAASIDEITQKSAGDVVGILEEKQNGHCHICHGKRARAVVFACDFTTHGYCAEHCMSKLRLNIVDAAAPRPLTLDFCPICCLSCGCSQCARRLDARALELKKRSIAQAKSLYDTEYDDILSQWTATRQTMPKKPKRVSIENKRSDVVKKVPVCDFPVEFFGRIEMEPGTPEDYRTVFDGNGTRLESQTLLEKCEAGVSKPEPSPRNQNTADTIEDGNVDYCQECKKAGDLLCCDYCPRAFHKACIAPVEPTDGDWECHICNIEKEGTKDDAVTGKGLEEKGKSSLDKICITLVHFDYSDGLREATQVLAIIHEMLIKLINYEFGYIFSEPVNLKAIPSYRKMVKKPMDLGTIVKNLENGTYANLYNESKSWDAVIVSVLQDIELVWHNCFTFNLEGSAIYRMAQVHRRKYLNIRGRSFEAFLSEFVKTSVADYVARCQSERNPTGNSSNQAKAKRHKISVPNSNSKVSRPVAVLDPDMGMLAKIYTTMKASCLACTYLGDLNHKTEWHPLTDNSIKVAIRNGAKDPNIRLFGYRWMFLDELRDGKVSFQTLRHALPTQPVSPITTTQPKAKAKQAAVRAVLSSQTVLDEIVEMRDGTSCYTFCSIEEALSFSRLPRHLPLEQLRCDLQNAPFCVWRPLAGFQLRKLHSSPQAGQEASPGQHQQLNSIPQRVSVVKQDCISGRRLVGFVTQEAAFQDWVLACKYSPVFPQGTPLEISVFQDSFLDKENYVDGVGWKTVVQEAIPPFKPAGGAKGMNTAQDASSSALNPPLIPDPSIPIRRLDSTFMVGHKIAFEGCSKDVTAPLKAAAPTNCCSINTDNSNRALLLRRNEQSGIQVSPLPPNCRNDPGTTTTASLTSSRKSPPSSKGGIDNGLMKVDGDLEVLPAKTEEQLFTIPLHHDGSNLMEGDGGNDTEIHSRLGVEQENGLTSNALPRSQTTPIPPTDTANEGMELPFRTEAIYSRF